eukprot:gene13752-29246_t
MLYNGKLIINFPASLLISSNDVIVLKKGIKGGEYSSSHEQGGHIVEEISKFIPRENEEDKIAKLMEFRQTQRKNYIMPHYERRNPLIALIGSPGMGKSTFLSHFPESEAFKRYLNGRSPIVSTVTFSNDTATSVGAEAIGIRIVYGVAVSMGILDTQSYPWKLFHNTFMSSLP